MSTAFYTHADCLRHEMGAWHPESPQRLQAIQDILFATGMQQVLDQREAPLASEASLALVHTAEAIARVRDNCPVAGGQAAYFSLDADTTLNAHSWRAALRAAGAAMAATDAVIDGAVANAFCAIRPPGHHATPNEAMGFCLFNNVAIAAAHALQVRGLQRVAIIDFDVHHGNGTEQAFQDDPRVLMVSFFQHPFYPYSGTAHPADNMHNLPLPAHSGSDAVRQVVQQDWLPALHAHRPEMIFISAGFDAHREDEMAQMELDEADYAWMTQHIMAIASQYAQGRIVSCLEGGYHLSALARSVLAHIQVLAQRD